MDSGGNHLAPISILSFHHILRYNTTLPPVQTALVRRRFAASYGQRPRPERDVAQATQVVGGGLLGLIQVAPHQRLSHGFAWTECSECAGVARCHAGITLDQIGDGQYVEGEALAFAWQLINQNPAAPVYVRSNEQVYSIMVQIPGVSVFGPPP